MPSAPCHHVTTRLWLCVLLLMSLSACGRGYRFQYEYSLIEPHRGQEGVEDEHVRIILAPVAHQGLLSLVVVNKSSQPIMIVWEQTYYIDPRGHRQAASETGLGWFYRPQEWFTTGTPIAPGHEFRAQVQPGEHQTYNPLTVSQQASGAVSFSTSPGTLFPTTGHSPTVGKKYEGQEFRFVLGLRLGSEISSYPFTFRITNVNVQQS